MSTVEDEIKFPKLDFDSIIAMKGLPCMGKSEIANALGKWAGSPVLYINDFLYTLQGYTSESPPPNSEAAHHLHRHAFGGLFKAASHRQRLHNRCVVIKSRLDSPLELDGLAQLGVDGSFRMILIIECRTRNEYRWARWFDGKPAEQKEYWYKLKSWKDIREYRDNFLDRPKLDFGLHFRPFLEGGGSVIGIELDPFDDLILDPTTKNTFMLTSSFLRIISEKLSTRIYHRYDNRRFSVWRDDLLFHDAVQPSRKYLCGKGVQRCFFDCGLLSIGLYRTVSLLSKMAILSAERVSRGYKCGACEMPVTSQESWYSCPFCCLILHKSCALLRGFQSPGFRKLDLVKEHPFWDHGHPLPSSWSPQACESCKDENKNFSNKCNSCIYHNYLKKQVFPTVVKGHKSHRHTLSIKFEENSVCKACNGHIPLCSYGCYWCSVSYHMECLLLPQELKHEHGGYQHVMELKYSLRGMEVEEGYWCNVCYQDMDPQNWFYSCQECHYEAHPLCTKPFSNYEEEYASKLNETASSSTS